MSDADHRGLGTAARAALDALAGGAPVALVRLVPAAPGGGTGAGGYVLVREDGMEGTLGSAELDALAADVGRRALREDAPAHEAVGDDLMLFAQPYRAAQRLVIAGGGHIAVELATVGARLGFRVLIMEDREEFADAARFGPGVETRLVDFADAFADVRLGPDTYLVLVTRGHEHDLACLRTVLTGTARPAYVGLIGSRRRVRAAFVALQGAGIPDSDIHRLYAPIGLDIGAETPAEIAVAIAAELIAVRHGVTPPGALRSRERVLERLLARPEHEPGHGGTAG
ncbi:MAG TPA: XdhC family protein [Longimicrobiales bacterium]|nr:XdhC family protein [Longimicrobiales bacterium]